MSEVVSYIIELFKQFHPLTQIFLIIFLGGFLVFFYNFIKNKELRNSVFKIVRRISIFNQDNYLSHDLFYNKVYYSTLIKRVTFESKIKTELFRLLLTIKVNTSIDLTKKWLKEVKKISLNNDFLLQFMFDNLINIVKTYETEVLRAFIDKLGVEKGEKAYHLVYSRNKVGFKEIHNEHIDYIERNIMKLTRSRAFSTQQKIYAYLTQIDIALEIAITDCEESFELLNGDLNKL